LVFKQS